MTPGIRIEERTIAAAAIVRAIPTARLRAAVLLPLVTDEATLDDLAELESATNPRLVSINGRALDLDAAELAPARVAGHTIINAAFCHPRTGGNRFNDGRRGAWYGADEAETCLAEVIFHIEREFEAIGWPAEAMEYSILHAEVGGNFADLTGLGAHAALDPEPRVGYPAGQALAADLRRQGFHGAVYPSARRPPELCYVVFAPKALRKVREGTVYRLTWAGGGPGPTVTKLTA